MKERQKKTLFTGIGLLTAFGIWTLLIQYVDVQSTGQNGTNIGFATFNIWFHKMTSVYMWLYTVTDWFGLVPIVICLGFGGLGFVQLVKRRSLFKVDIDILLLGVYYVLVIFCYLFFEMVPINYRPILINGFMEASYPSSTTLLVLSVMPTLKLQIDRRCTVTAWRTVTDVFVLIFSAFMVIGRLISGVHWATDIIGSVFLSAGLFMLYWFSVITADEKNTGEKKNGIQ